MSISSSVTSIPSKKHIDFIKSINTSLIIIELLFFVLYASLFSDFTSVAVLVDTPSNL